ncbi:hypothetical protein BC831DRAFT_430120 [Entophlyctis helioformis]|nr:hypothetical protein BC831DRAFT_430120 [Entophlyctis helioformis]
MDQVLRCNNLACRQTLSARAVVTTCSHVFCVDCGTRAFSAALVCPACETSLTQRDDIVVSELCPTEDYKSSVLAGLRPEIVIEITSRALSFWTYQCTQESAYQSALYKSLDEQCAKLERQLQSIVRDANQEVSALQDKINAIVKEAEMERARHHSLAEQFAEKNRQFMKLQTMYDKLKRRTLLQGQRKDDGSGAADQHMPSQDAGSRLSSHLSGQPLTQRSSAGVPGGFQFSAFATDTLMSTSTFRSGPLSSQLQPQRALLSNVSGGHQQAPAEQMPGSAAGRQSMLMQPQERLSQQGHHAHIPHPSHQQHQPAFLARHGGDHEVRQGTPRPPVHSGQPKHQQSHLTAQPEYQPLFTGRLGTSSSTSSGSGGHAHGMGFSHTAQRSGIQGVAGSSRGIPPPRTRRSPGTAM